MSEIIPASATLSEADYRQRTGSTPEGRRTILEDMTAPVREAARVILLDSDQRVLLLRYDENGGFWATPGGSLEPGEDHRTAALRELREELGVDHVELGPLVAERSQEHLVGGQQVRQAERYHAAWIDPVAVDPGRATQRDNIRSHRWWPLEELRATDQTVYPLGLAELLHSVLDQGVPQRPVVLTG